MSERVRAVSGLWVGWLAAVALGAASAIGAAPAGAVGPADPPKAGGFDLQLEVYPSYPESYSWRAEEGRLRLPAAGGYVTNQVVSSGGRQYSFSAPPGWQLVKDVGREAVQLLEPAQRAELEFRIFRLPKGEPGLLSVEAWQQRMVRRHAALKGGKPEPARARAEQAVVLRFEEDSKRVSRAAVQCLRVMDGTNVFEFELKSSVGSIGEFERWLWQVANSLRERRPPGEPGSGPAAAGLGTEGGVEAVGPESDGEEE